MPLTPQRSAAGGLFDIDLPFTLLELAGAVALLLWGVHMVQTGVQRTFGASLRGFLGRALRRRSTAFAAGVGVTAALQSSTATGLMLTGFASQGMVELAPGLAVMLGAGVGTTLIVQLLAFDVAMVSPALILIGVVLFRRAPSAAKDFGRVLIGLGLLLMALHQFVTLLTPLANEPWMRTAMAGLSDNLVPAVIAAALITWAAHSSVAVVLLVMSFATRGLIPVETAFALVLGANLGTAINPILEGAQGAGASARRLPIGNLALRLVGVAAVLLAWPWVTAWMAAGDAGRAIANFHTAFNLVLAAVAFPFLTPYAQALTRLLPDKAGPVDPGAALYLDRAALRTPVVALTAAARETLRMADVLEEMLTALKLTFEKPDQYRIGETRRMEDVLDRLNAAIKDYVTALDSDAMSEDDHRRALQILTFATNLEQAADLVDRNLLGGIAKKMKRGVDFSDEGRAELVDLTSRLMANVRIAASIFMSGEARAARLLLEEKAAFREAQNAATAGHFQRLRTGRRESAATSSIHLDALRDLRRVNAHLVAGAAHPVLDGAAPVERIEAAE